MLRVCILGILLGVSIKIGNASNNINIVLVKEVNLESLTIEQRITKVLNDSGYSINMQEIILAKADLESGAFRNTLTRNHNNFFSMLHSKYDPYSKCGCGFAEGRSGYASYPSIEDQVYAYLWYTKRKGYPKEATPVEYVRFMKSKGYFTANEKKYLAGLLNRLDKYKLEEKE